MKIEKKDKIIEIKEEVVIEQDDKKIILEKGDRIKVIEETSRYILPIGSVDLRTGKNSMITNIYETWNNEDMHCEFWKEGLKGTIKMIFGAGLKAYNQIGSVNTFLNDQTHKFLFRASLIDSCSLNDIQSRISEYGSKLNGYVFK